MKYEIEVRVMGEGDCLVLPIGDPIEARNKAIQAILIAYEHSKVAQFLPALKDFFGSIVMALRLIVDEENKITLIDLETPTEKLIDNWGKEFEILTANGWGISEETIKIFSVVRQKEITVFASSQELLKKIKPQTELN